MESALALNGDRTNLLCAPALGSFLLAMAISAAAAPTLFFDDFTEPVLNSTWQASLPTMKIAYPRSGTTQLTTYLGAPNYASQTLGAASVLRMSSSLAPHERRGWTSSTFSAPAFRYEARFNTLNQSSKTSIDAFIEIAILDAANPARYDILCPYGAVFSALRSFAAGSSIENTFTATQYNYQNNTWYRIALDATPGQNIRASLLSDDGTELVGFSLGHGAEAYSCGFKLALSQAMGEPYRGQWPAHVAVDYVHLTGVPEQAHSSGASPAQR